MAETFHIVSTVTGAQELADQLGDAAHALLPKLRAASQYNAQLVKEAWKASLTGQSHAKLMPYGITYDTTVTTDGVLAEVGAEADSGYQAGVVLLEEYGVGSKNTARREFGQKAVEANAADLEEGVSRAIAQALGSIG